MGKGKKEEESTAILWMPFREMQGGGSWRFFWNALSVRGQNAFGTGMDGDSAGATGSAELWML